ncbi:MAG: PKD repeat protein, partial [bacterium]
MPRLNIILLTCLLIGVSAYGQSTSNFTADTTNGCTPVTVNFSDKSTGKITNWYWTFGNGNTSTKQNPSAIFYKPGTYTVTLKTTDDTGKEITETKTTYVEVFELPVADFKPLKTSGCAPLSVPFTNKTKEGSAKIVDVTWDFGDGNTTNTISGYHVYKFAGTYSVSMLAIDANGCSDKIKKDNIIEVWPVPEVDFTADETFACVPPLDVQFTNLTTKGGTGFTYSWNLGDGNTSTSQNPKNTYTSNGNYDVSLVVTNSKGCKGSKQKKSFINVNPIDVDFGIDKNDGCAPLDVTFTNKTKPDISGLSYNWDLGNGKKFQTKQAATTYDKAGSYTVSLTVSKNGKCNQTRTYANKVIVKPTPNPKIMVSDSVSCSVPFDVDVEDIGSGATDWNWLLDGSSATQGQKSKITITNFASHVISLVTKNNYGCVSDTMQKLIQVRPIEVTAAPDTQGCVPMNVLFRNTTILGKYAMDMQYWDFGDGETKEISDTSVRSISHKYTERGVYKIVLKVTTKEGCENKVTLTVKVGEKRKPVIEPGIDTLCNASEGQILNLTNTNLKDSIDKIIWKLIPANGKGVLKGALKDSAVKAQFGYRWHYKFPVRDQDTGYYDAVLITQDNGCFDTTVMPNRIYILPPVAKIKPLHDTCANDIMILANISRFYDSINWVVNKHTLLDSIIRVGTDSAKDVTLRAYNSTSKCIDSVSFKFEAKQTFSGGFSATGDLCAPTSYSFRGSAGESYLSYLWIINDKDSFFKRGVTISFPQPGAHKVYYRATDTSKTGGCARAMEMVYNVTGPTVSGSIDAKPGCGPLDVILKTTSKPKNYTQLYWQIGVYQVPVDSLGLDTFELFQPGPDDGKWPISLIGVDSNGCKGSEDFETEVYGTKEASLKITRFKDCNGRKFIFSPLFAKPVDDSKWTYKWDLGDGQGSSDQKVVNYTFEKSGKYLVKVYMTDENGCVTRLQDTVNIEDEVLRAKFFADSLIKDCPPLHVSFEDRSTLNALRRIIKWEWDFGDGTGSQERYPSKLYLKSGNYDVSLKVTDEWGCQDSFSYPGFVLVKGPIGNYIFDKTEGCVPLAVKFTADTSKSNGFTWDFGDGNILKNKLVTTHTYLDTGRFIPLLTMSDTFGCTYTHPPIDTIYVYPQPIPDFGMSRPCPGVPTQFTSNTWPVNATQYAWDFGDGGVSTDKDPQHIYATGGKYPVTLKVTTEHGCTKDTVKYVNIKKIKADFKTSQSEVCVGSSIEILDQSASDGTIVRWEWTINDTFLYQGANPQLQFTTVGQVKIRLIIEDDIGCTDTLMSTQDLRVGDTIPPPPTPLLRVSVMNDNSYLLDYKRSPISDFKSYIIYHNNVKIDEVFSQDDTRYQIPSVNTLENVYCARVSVQNACGLESVPIGDEEDCTVESKAVGQLNKARVSWNAYAGWNKVGKYLIYRHVGASKPSFQLLDSVLGDQLEYIDTNVLCYRKHWYKIMAVEANGNKQISWSDTCAATPIYVNSLPPNELVRATVQHDKYVTIEWLPTPYSKMPIEHYELEKSNNGLDYRLINDQLSPTTFETDDNLVEVDSQSYFYRVSAVDICKDKAPYSNLAKTIL